MWCYITLYYVVFLFYDPFLRPAALELGLMVALQRTLFCF